MTHTTRRSWRFICAGAAVFILVGAAFWSNDANQPDASRTVKLTRPMRAFGAVHPQLSPDGRHVIFSYHGSIWRMATDGDVMQRMFSDDGYATEPCWAPDGKRIAFLHGPGWDAGQLKIMDASTGKVSPLTTKIFGRGRIAFTADGQSVVGILRGPRMIESLRRLNLKNGELKTLLRLKSFRNPWAISSDGKWIAFVTTMDVAGQQGGNDGPQADVWKIALDGGEPTKIVRFPARIHDVCWSANGESLFASSELGGAHNDLWRIDLANPQRPTKLTFGQADEERPSVSSDGRWLLHTDNHEGCPALILRNLASGASRTISVAKLDFGAATGRFHLAIRDKTSSLKSVARVSIRAKNGSYHAPPGVLWRTHRNHAHFYVTKSVEFDLPVGEYEIRIFHGPEYRVFERGFKIQAGDVTKLDVGLERWTNPAGEGWFSGDNHIHANYGYGEYYNMPNAMAEMCAGEDLHVCNFMVANSDGDGIFDREFFRGRLDPRSAKRTLLYWNEEFRSTIWGHLTLVNLKQVVEPIYTGFKDTTNPWDIPTISDIADRTHIQNGVVNYTHPSARIDDLYKGAYTAKGLPIFAALGKIDTMDVMGSNDRASTALYHKLLNCGFRLGVSAGTDCFLNRIRSFLPGAERVYVKTGKSLIYRKWIDGLKSSNSFATNGPMLILTVDKTDLGGTVKMAGPGMVAVDAHVSSQFPLTRIEIMHNGKVAHVRKPSKKGLTTKLTAKLPVKKSGWIALRVIGPSHPDVEGVNVYAHTSPVYVNVKGASAGNPEEARYFLAWIDQLWNTVQFRERIQTKEHRETVLAQIEQARAVYRGIIAKANGD